MFATRTRANESKGTAHRSPALSAPAGQAAAQADTLETVLAVRGD